MVLHDGCWLQIQIQSECRMLIRHKVLGILQAIQEKLGSYWLRVQKTCGYRLYEELNAPLLWQDKKLHFLRFVRLTLSPLIMFSLFSGKLRVVISYTAFLP